MLVGAVSTAGAAGQGSIVATGHFLENLGVLLDIASTIIVAAVVALAIYQIAIARRRLPGIAAVLAGALLIAAAAQLTNVIIANGNHGSSATTFPASAKATVRRTN